MSYFPLFIDLSGAEVLIVGGGIVALRKVQKLLPYGASITLVAPEIVPELSQEVNITILPRPYDASLLTGRRLVIAATDDRTVNHAISLDCQARGIPVNVVDCREDCTFIFPSLVKAGKLSVGISTGGASPSAAIWLRQRIEALLPDSFGDILSYLDALRPRFKAELATEVERSKLYKALFARCVELQRPLTDEELMQFLRERDNDGK